LLASIECSAQFTFVFAADVEMHAFGTLTLFFFQFRNTVLLLQ